MPAGVMIPARPQGARYGSTSSLSLSQVEVLSESSQIIILSEYLFLDNGGESAVIEY